MSENYRKLHKLNGNYTDNLSNEKLLRENVLLLTNGWFRAFHIFCITFRRFTRTLNGASVKQIGANMAKSYWVFFCTAAEQAGMAWGGECLLGKVALHVRRIHSLHVRRRQLRTVDLGLFSDLSWLTVMFGLKVAWYACQCCSALLIGGQCLWGSIA